MSGPVQGELRDIFTIDLGVGAHMVQADTTLTDDLGFDSVAFAIGLVAIQERLGVQVSAQELFACSTIGDIGALIQRSETKPVPGGEGPQ